MYCILVFFVTDNCIELLERLNCTTEQVNCRNKSEFYLTFIKTKHMLNTPAKYVLSLREIQIIM